jgi:hypothetical protein
MLAGVVNTGDQFVTGVNVTGKQTWVSLQENDSVITIGKGPNVMYCLYPNVK